MKRIRKLLSVVVGVAVASLLITGIVLASGGSNWLSAGNDRQNTRYQSTESKIGVENVADLAVKWAFTTGGDVSATPAVDGDTVYVPDWAGNLYAIDRRNGQVEWQVNIATVTGVPGDKARTTPAISGNKVIIGTQGPFGGGGRVLAFDKSTGALLWSTVADTHPAAIITQSATVFGNRVYVGVSSQEEALRGPDPGLLLLLLPGQHARPRSQHRSHHLEDLHGAGGLHWQCRLGQQPGH